MLTKLDGTARGGVVVALAERFGLPVHAVGVGEGEDDLQPFDADFFAAVFFAAVFLAAVFLVVFLLVGAIVLHLLTRPACLTWAGIAPRGSEPANTLNPVGSETVGVV